MSEEHTSVTFMENTVQFNSRKDTHQVHPPMLVCLSSPMTVSMCGCCMKYRLFSFPAESSKLSFPETPPL